MKNIEIESWLINFIKNNSRSGSLYWYPLVQVNSDLPIVAYKISAIYKDNAMHLLEELMVACNIKQVDTFQMDSCEYFEDDNITNLLYEKDIDGFSFPWYVETFYFDKTRDWIIYVSHENTISFYGYNISSKAKMIINSCYLCQ